MDAFTFFSTHSYNLSLSCRTAAVNFILKHGIPARSFIDVIYKVDEKRKIFCYHVLDMTVENHPYYLNESLDLFIENALTETHESLKRCISRTVYHQLKSGEHLYTAMHKQQIATTMFDWIITDSWVATRVNAIHVLYFLVDEEEWIREQLIAVIEQYLPLQEPSFVSRGKKILKLLHKRKS